ncbi:DUF3108 domain-containing protein [Gluconacetobacter azotocaptans]|uniref:DUF3108 domain-containing protein n=1 Tax=Gluconacetobacter azotocaptans TaxID=142834 RepID=A0A7W4PH32_9PROT|nr:DUF3108 domain-containing protein [Gluconacetobacter azotocaptans]MBB2190666.1 DUF3108 domain-containing protein [Gluconacetobacter azotocaptans]MBM9400938.1 DUF3108 domain-containing protein [Gluconacetobacter azotocaptans]GBQ30358.1 hypothetical protein AA13594_1701 [Gluconacetobacter azotocaptans DSM 13594]
MIRAIVRVLALGAGLVAGPVLAADMPPQVDQTYAVYSHGFRVLAISARYSMTPTGYAIRATMQSGGLMGLLFHMNITSQATGRFVDDGVQPLTYDSAGFSRGADRHVVMAYDDGRARIALQTPPETGRDPIPADDLAPAVDSLSALMRLQQAVRTRHACDGSAIVFDGVRLLRMEARTVGAGQMPDDSRQPYRGTAFRCDFSDVQIAGFRRSEGPDSPARRPILGSVWFQDVPGIGETAVRIVFDHPKLGRLMVMLRPEG